MDENYRRCVPQYFLGKPTEAITVMISKNIRIFLHFSSQERSTGKKSGPAKLINLQK